MTEPDNSQEQIAKIDESTFRKLISEVNKLKDDIKAMNDGIDEIRKGQQTIEDLLEVMEKKS
jgi:uncharacterized protein YdcH (DUF465 family)